MLGLSKSSDGEIYLFHIKTWDLSIHKAAYSHFESGCLCRGMGGFHSRSVKFMWEKEGSHFQYVNMVAGLLEVVR